MRFVCHRSRDSYFVDSPDNRNSHLVSASTATGPFPLKAKTSLRSTQGAWYTYISVTTNSFVPPLAVASIAASISASISVQSFYNVSAGAIQKRSWCRRLPTAQGSPPFAIRPWAHFHRRLSLLHGLTNVHTDSRYVEASVENIFRQMSDYAAAAHRRRRGFSRSGLRMMSVSCRPFVRIQIREPRQKLQQDHEGTNIVCVPHGSADTVKV